MTHPGIIYLDNHSTTPMDQRVLEAMLPYFTEDYGNASSTSHEYGWSARDAVAAARAQVAALVGGSVNDIVFTSGATESDNLAIKGVAEARATEGRHLITAPTEHKAVLESIGYLEKRGWDVTYLGVDRSGSIDIDELRRSLRDDTVLVSLMAVNNEIGTIHPVAEIADAVKDSTALLHVDAAQALTYGSLNLSEVPIDLVSISGHKMYGPKGIGALYVRSTCRSQLSPQMNGGQQERGLRSGTLDVPAIVGFGRAASIAASSWPADASRVAYLRDLLEEAITSSLDDIEVVGAVVPRHPGNLNLIVGGVDAQTLLSRLRGSFAASTGSACAASTPEASHVLVACGFTHEEGLSAVRFGVGRQNTADDVEAVAAAVVEDVRILRELESVERVQR